MSTTSPAETLYFCARASSRSRRRTTTWPTSGAYSQKASSYTVALGAGITLPEKRPEGDKTDAREFTANPPWRR